MSKSIVGLLECCCNKTVTAQHFSTPAYRNRCLRRCSSLKWVPDMLSYRSVNWRGWKWGYSSA